MDILALDPLGRGLAWLVASNPVGVGLISSLPRPGGNITGLTTNNIEITGKRLEILKEISRGKVSRVAWLFNPADPSNAQALRAHEDAAAKLGMTLRPFPVKAPEEFDAAFSAMAAERMDSLVVAAGVFTGTRTPAARRLVNC